MKYSWPLLLGCLALAGCSGEAPPDQEMPPPLVTLAPVEQKTVTDYVDLTGRAMSKESVKLRARVWGHLDEIKFTEGADVKKDQVLFILDRRPYQAAFDRVDAEVGQQEAKVKRLEGDFARARNLVSTRSIAKEEFEKVSGDLSEAQAALKSAQAGRAVAKLNLDYTEIKAPIDGRISRAMVTKGNLVESGELGGTMLTTLVSLAPIYVYFDVDDITFRKIAPYVDKASKTPPPVLVGLPGETTFPIRGEINFIDNQIDPGTATMKMRGEFTNKDRRLTPGMFVRVRVPLGDEHSALLITDKAIDVDQGQKVVYAINKDNVAEKRIVKLGGLHDGLREITEGVRPGDRLVIEGLQRVRHGAKVTPKS